MTKFYMESYNAASKRRRLRVQSHAEKTVGLTQHQATELLKPARQEIVPRDLSGNAALGTPEFELCFPILEKAGLCYMESRSLP